MQHRANTLVVGGANARTAAWLAWLLCALSLTLTGFGLLFHILNLSEPSVPTFTYWVESTLMGVGASTFGAIIASHRTHNPIGWLLSYRVLYSGRSCLLRSTLSTRY